MTTPIDRRELLAGAAVSGAAAVPAMASPAPVAEIQTVDQARWYLAHQSLSIYRPDLDSVAMVRGVLRLGKGENYDHIKIGVITNLDITDENVEMISSIKAKGTIKICGFPRGGDRYDDLFTLWVKAIDAALIPRMLSPILSDYDVRLHYTRPLTDEEAFTLAQWAYARR